MDFDLKQCRMQGESEAELQHSAKICKFFAEQPHHQPESSSSSSSTSSSTTTTTTITTTTSVLPLFVPVSNSFPTKTSTILSAFPYSTSSSSSTNTLPRMWGFFSVAQRQELELQALIFRYMLAGAAVPPELLHPIKKSLLSSTTTPFFLHHPLQYPTSLLQAGYWGRAAMDPEPGRCRRTDGKKWRCSRDVVAGQKYCERHMHRGRNRSRKPVEIATTNPAAAAAASASGGGCSLSSCNTNRGVGGGGRPFSTVESGNYFSLCGQTPSVDLLHLNQRASFNSLSENKNFYETHREGSAGDEKSDGHILRHFFDDWPRSDNGGNDNNVSQQMNSTSTSATSLSISTPGNPSLSSDVSLKLSTGGSSGQGSGHHQHIHQDGNVDREHVQLNWAAGWAASQMASMGGPLAEALRSANNNSLPTSVLHQLQRATTNSEASFIST